MPILTFDNLGRPAGKNLIDPPPPPKSGDRKNVAYHDDDDDETGSGADEFRRRLRWWQTPKPLAPEEMEYDNESM